MGRDTIQPETAVSTISLEYLQEFTSEYRISEDLHPELPVPGDRIVDFPENKIGVYTKFFEFANFRIPISQFLFNILEYYQIYLSQLLVIGASKDEKPAEGSYSAEDVARLDTRRTPIQIQPEALLCLVGLSQRYYLGDDVYPTFLYDDGWEMDLFNLISAPNLAKVKTGTRLRAAHEVPLLTVTANRVIDMGELAATTESFGTPSTIERSPLDFDNENPSQQINEGDGTEDQDLETGSPEVPPTGHAPTTGVAPNIVIEEEDAADVPLVSKRRRKRVNDEAEANAPPKVLRKDFDVSRPAPSTFGGKSFASTGLEACSILSALASQGTPASTIDPDPLSFAEPQPAPTRDIAESSKGATVAGDPDSEKSSSFTSFAGSPGSIYQPGWEITNSCRFDTPGACQDAVDHMVPPEYFLELRHLPNEEFLNQYNVNLARQVAIGSQLRLRFEQEVRLLKKAKEKVAKRDQRIHAREEEIKKLDQEVQGLRNQTRNLETLLEAEVDMKKAAEANMSALEAQVRGDEQIKTAFEEFKKYEEDKVERRCAEMDARLDALSIDFDDELYPHMLTAIAGRRWVIRNGLRLAVMKCAESIDLRKAQLDLVVIEAYDPEADAKYVAALHALKDLEYPLIDYLEKLKDDHIDLIIASLHLESDVGEETPQWIRELRPNAITANVSHAEKKKKCRFICRTHGVGSAHHPRSDGIPVLVPTVASQGLAILLTDASTQT
ncbi:hypothetical protein Tco_1113345 [Tanacetum coccineum]|uniref:Transposase (Putative), gypsy type n=1 Tax=Tanacetum coccineum TaxID=301880 RepID=A0ABQ5IS01_9ASTR